MQITTRTAQAHDVEFLYALHCVTMRAYVEATYGAWNEVRQRAYFLDHLELSAMRVLQAGGDDVGMIAVYVRSEEIFISALEVLPAWQGQGIGSAALQIIIAEARQQSKPVALQVLHVNQRARALYLRLGFKPTHATSNHEGMIYEQPK